MGDKATPSKHDINPPINEYPRRPLAAFRVCVSIGPEGAGVKADGNDVIDPPSGETSVGRGLDAGEENVVGAEDVVGDGLVDGAREGPGDDVGDGLVDGAREGPGDVVGDGLVDGADVFTFPPQSNDVPVGTRYSAWSFPIETTIPSVLGTRPSVVELPAHAVAAGYDQFSILAPDQSCPTAWIVPFPSTRRAE
jgi:hypothetical protein